MKLAALAAVAVFPLCATALSVAGCNRDYDAAVKVLPADAGTAIPTEEDYEEAAEAAITPENLEGEIAKLEAELAATAKP